MNVDINTQTQNFIHQLICYNGITALIYSIQHNIAFHEITYKHIIKAVIDIFICFGIIFFCQQKTIIIFFIRTEQMERKLVSFIDFEIFFTNYQIVILIYLFCIEFNCNMLNILLERAMQNSVNQHLQAQPIFTFSYSTKKRDEANLNSIHKTIDQRKIIKTDKKIDKELTTWKSKTIEKLQKFEISTPQTNIANIWARKTGMKMNKKNAKFSGRQNKSQIQQSTNQQPEYCIKGASPHRSLRSPLGKTLYLKYKYMQEQKQSPKKKTSSFNSRSVTTERTSRNSGNIFMKPIQIQCSPEQVNQNKKTQTSKVGFLKTIQYLATSKQQILQRRTEDMENRKKSMRQTRQKFRKTIILQMNGTQSFLNTYEENQQAGKEFSRTKKEKTQSFHIRFNTKKTQKKFESYRPWSPVKTNPLYVDIDDDELMLKTLTDSIKRKSYEKETTFQE